MNVLTVPRTVARLEYSALRLPLTLTENQVGRLLEEDSALRLGFEKALGNLDARVGRLLGDPVLTRRGATLSRRAIDHDPKDAAASLPGAYRLASRNVSRDAPGRGSKRTAGSRRGPPRRTSSPRR
jgi:hypothetical protein